MRVGIVGAGSMGHAHATGWSATAATIVGVVSGSGASARELAARVGARVYPNVTSMLADVDVVDLCVPTDLHHAMTLECAAAGKHVVCEKPMALTIEHAREMIEACRRSGVHLMVAHVLRFFPQYRAAATAVREGVVGDLGVVRLRRVSYPPRPRPGSWFGDEARSGGMILDLMIHDLDFVRTVAGPVERVFAKSIRGRGGASGPSMRDYVLATLRFESGAMALVEGGWAYPKGTFRTGFDVAGRMGVLEWSSDDTETITEFLDHDERPADEVGLPLTVMAEDPYTTEIKAIARALSSGERFEVTPEEALEALRLALAVKRSVVTGTAVRPSEVG